MATKLTAKDMAALFEEVEVGPNLDSEKSADYGNDETNENSVRPFNEVCDDIKTTMVEESVALKEPEPELPTPNPTITETIVPQKEPVKESLDINNPLGLSPEDLKAFHAIQKKYPQFKLYDGSQSFKNFYSYKVTTLKSLLTSFAVLPLRDMQKEVQQVRVNHQIGDQVASPNLIRQKLDDAYAGRTRLVSMLAQAHDQFPSWKKNAEMLSSKLWRDHESKGAHKRQALDLEHMFDMSVYIKALEGFIDSATIIDNLLKAASESLSRQLSCVLVHHQAGLAEEEAKTQLEDIQHKTNDRGLDNLDTVAEGTVIRQSKNGGILTENDFGASVTDDDDFLADVGI